MADTRSLGNEQKDVEPYTSRIVPATDHTQGKIFHLTPLGPC
jgi:hypothetical protein